MDADAIVVGAGLAGIVAATELVDAGKSVILVDQENAANLGGQAFWSFGGLFLVDTPQQRRLGVRDSFDLAWQDWQGSAGWDRVTEADGTPGEDSWAARWGRNYVEWAAGEKRHWLKRSGISLTPVVGWAERGGSEAGGHGNSVPRFHVAWGTGTGVVAPFAARVLAAEQDGRLRYASRHRVDELVVTGGVVTGVTGAILASDESARGEASTRDAVGEFRFEAPAVIVTTGGIGGNHELVREFWPERLGTPPAHMISGVPEYVDGRGLAIAEAAGAHLVNRDRMWHYVEGIHNWDSIWPQHGIRILPGPSSLWFDAIGRRLPAPLLPGFDTLATLRHLRTDPAISAYDHSWFVLNTRIIAKEFALSGSEQNPDITNRDLVQVLKSRLSNAVPGPVAAFVEKGADFVTATSVAALVAKMNALVDAPALDAGDIERQIRARDAELVNPFTKDAQVMGIHNARRYRGDRMIRVATPGSILDPADGPLIAVKLSVLTRKSLGGIQTDLHARALDATGTPIPGLYAAGEVAGFGGGGAHGYNALEGTFLGGCLFSGRAAGRAAARQE